jgi:hypothetical protein
MLIQMQAKQILVTLNSLPSEKTEEVQHLILFLKERYGDKGAMDESDAWTDEDIHDLTAAVLMHAEQSL